METENLYHQHFETEETHKGYMECANTSAVQLLAIHANSELIVLISEKLRNMVAVLLTWKKNLPGRLIARSCLHFFNMGKDV